jgi:hypothetical protein
VRIGSSELTGGYEHSSRGEHTWTKRDSAEPRTGERTKNQQRQNEIVIPNLARACRWRICTGNRKAVESKNLAGALY